MSFGNPQPPTNQPFGVQDQQTSKTQQATPVPYIAGTRKVAVTWITPIYNLNSAPAPNQPGKGK